MSKVIEIYTFDAGSGHRAATDALKGVLAEQYPDWDIRPVDLQKLLEPVDLVHKLTQKMPPSFRRILEPLAPGIVDGPFRSQEFYNMAISHGQTIGVSAMLSLLQYFLDTKAPEIEGILRDRWRALAQKPDLVVSVIPNFNRLMFDALEGVFPSTPYVTIMTDLVDLPPHFWMEDQDQFLICGTTEAYAQAKATGFYNPNKLFAVSGMMLRKDFYGTPVSRRPPKLMSKLPTVIIMFGGNGSFVSEKIIQQLEEAQTKIQTIVMCGHNQELLASLRQRNNCHSVAFTSDVPAYLRVADIFIGKPGPGCVSEALHMGCPVIVENNISTLPQERPNVDWIERNGVGIGVKSLKRGIASTVIDMLANLDLYKANIKNNLPCNRAVYEVADILGQILISKEHKPAPSAVPHAETHFT
jgi:hypothetical protein